MGSPSKELLNALVAMAAEEEPSKWSRLKVISVMGVYVDVCSVTWNSVHGCSEKFSASAIDGNTIGKIFFF